MNGKKRAGIRDQGAGIRDQAGGIWNQKRTKRIRGQMRW